MNRACHALLPLLFLATATATATAQVTTGVFGVNDLQVAMPPSLPFPVGSNPLNGSTQSSCFFAGVHSPANVGTLSYQANVSPSATGALLILSWCGCSATSGIPFFPTQTAACNGPIAGGTNLWLGVIISPGCFGTATPIPSTPGIFNWRFQIPPFTPFSFPIWAQAPVFDPPCVPGGSIWPFKFTQAIGIQ
jgi:hypothetical protein